MPPMFGLRIGTPERMNWGAIRVLFGMLKDLIRDAGTLGISL
jgi:hypothetical protein